VYGPLDAPCNGPKAKPNHLVTIVGFGYDNSTGSLLPFWLVRNSWGRNWGQDGHMLLRAASGVLGGM
jgi:C1A family cysteine protease